MPFLIHDPIVFYYLFMSKPIEMRMPPNLNYFLYFLLLITTVGLAAIYIPRLVPDIGTIAVMLLCSAMIIMVVFILLRPMLGFLYARADGLMAVYMDQSERGFHLFSYHLNSGNKYGPSTRDIQHYFISLANGKLFYKSIYTHRMAPLAGRSGWQGFDSFETTILELPSLRASLDKFSVKLGVNLHLGRSMPLSGEHNCQFEIEGQLVRIGKFKKLIDEGLEITCTDKATGSVYWKKRI